MIAYISDLPSHGDSEFTNLRAIDINLEFSKNFSDADLSMIDFFNPEMKDINMLLDFGRERYIEIVVDLLFIGSGKREHSETQLALDGFTADSYRTLCDSIEKYRSFRHRDRVSGLQGVMELLVERGVVHRLGLGDGMLLFQYNGKILMDMAECSFEKFSDSFNGLE